MTHLIICLHAIIGIVIYYIATKYCWYWVKNNHYGPRYLIRRNGDNFDIHFMRMDIMILEDVHPISAFLLMKLNCEDDEDMIVRYIGFRIK